MTIRSVGNPGGGVPGYRGNLVDRQLAWIAGAIAAAGSNRMVAQDGTALDAAYNTLANNAAVGATVPVLAVHRARRCNDCTPLHGAFDPFAVSPVTEKASGAGWRPQIDEQCSRWIWEAAFTDLVGAGANLRAGVGVAMVNGAAGAGILTNGAGIGFLLAGSGDVRLRIRAEAGGADLLSQLISVADISDWHRYEIRIFPATFGGPARLQCLVDDGIVYAGTWDDNVVILPRLGGSFTGTSFHGVMGNTTADIDHLYVADYRQIIGVSP